MAEKPNSPAPHNLEAEEASLGALLIDPEEVLNLRPFLKAEDFYKKSHQWIYAAILDLSDAGRPVDILTVATELERQGHLEQAGGAVCLRELVDSAPTSFHAESYGRIVQREAIARETIETAREIAKLGNTNSLGATDMVGEVQKLALKLGDRMESEKPARAVGVIADEYMTELLAAMENPDSFAGVSTRLIDIDAMLGGLRAPDLNLIAGRPGTGKTAFMLTVAINAAKKDGKRIYIASMEMGEKQVIERLLAQLSGINLSVLHRNATVKDDLPKLAEAIKVLHRLSIHISDKTMLTPDEFRNDIIKYKLRHGLDLAILDYLQLMEAGRNRGYDNRVQEISYISRRIKQTAGELNIPILAGSQLSRAVESRQGKRPILSDLRESGSMEQDSDVVMFTHDDEKQANVTDIIVGKNRHGPVGDVQLYFHRETTSFHNAETRTVSLY